MGPGSSSEKSADTVMSRRVCAAAKKAEGSLAICHAGLLSEAATGKCVCIQCCRFLAVLSSLNVPLVASLRGIPASFDLKLRAIPIIHCIICVNNVTNPTGSRVASVNHNSSH